jgi:hypothetical protein
VRRPSMRFVRRQPPWSMLSTRSPRLAIGGTTVSTATRRSRGKSLPPVRAQRLAGGRGLKRAVAVLLAPVSAGALGPEARRQHRRDRIAQRRRERGRTLASAIHDLGADAFEKLGTLERELLQRHYGVGGERRWTRRELVREFGLSSGRVEDLVDAAVSTLTGMKVAPRFDRTCAVCGGSFTFRSRVSRRRTCGSGCTGELKRAAGRASGRARRTDPPPSRA